MKTGVIYKITSPNLSVYIGKSINWNVRYRKYKSFCCQTQTKLYRSFMKYGFENHWFEIIHSNIKEELLNELEINEILNNNSYYFGLNCTRGGDDAPSANLNPENAKKDRN